MTYTRDHVNVADLGTQANCYVQFQAGRWHVYTLKNTYKSTSAQTRNNENSDILQIENILYKSTQTNYMITTPDYNCMTDCPLTTVLWICRVS